MYLLLCLDDPKLVGVVVVSKVVVDSVLRCLLHRCIHIKHVVIAVRRTSYEFVYSSN